MTRPVYGRVYELRLRGQADADHSYVGLTRQLTIHRRVHGPSGHTSPDDIARDPWKARILPGRDGYRQLEVVYSTGDPAEDERSLRRAEAFWIDRLRPIHNEVRPVRPFGDRPAPRPVTAPRPRRAVAVRRRRRSAKPYVLAALILTFTFLAARMVVAMQLPWPAAPWIAAPTLGVALGWTVFWRVHRAFRKLLR